MAALWVYVLAIFGVFSVIHAVTYFLPILLIALLPVPNLKKKYSAQWALVTGGSSGIGRSIVDKLASQGLNIVIVSLDDDLLAKTKSELKAAYSQQEFRTVGVTFAPNVDYMTAIKQATSDIKIQIVFNNAGYIMTGFFEQNSLEKHLANLECNATAAVSVTHHFLSQMLESNSKGCIVFTSSAAANIPSPFSCLYGSTKAFLSQFAASLAVESRARGIDIVANHPSPVTSNFYNNTHKLDSLEMALKLAVTPDEMRDEIFKSVGRCHLRDIGASAIIMRLAMSVLGWNTASTLFAVGAPFMGDFQRYNKQKAKAS